MSRSDPTQRIGKWFSWFAWIALLFILYWWFGGILDGQQNPNQQVESYRDGERAVVTLQQNRSGHYVANGEINGRGVTFMLDTGATQVAIPASLGQELNLQRGAPVMVMTANGRARAYTTSIDQLRLGEIELQNVSATLVPGYEGSQILLGMSALKTLEFTQRNHELTITQ
ncbi:TIGR02281 family clan AA aspartic protease [Aliidiomarina minuta]|uniref:TIGR02281 family clan AA aspartic protease n=1 Tax=Aliidiomarina minuta TaxID=880057 RepID=A0A432W9E8_9GAMM|nr:TIGR02281 family clan AA aspartic protease [Aliidiomarina minuta]RUO26606.1 TIGR02281 family clan AA aspartic protease [Aliidiomarina minuta]